MQFKIWQPGSIISRVATSGLPSQPGCMVSRVAETHLGLREQKHTRVSGNKTTLGSPGTKPHSLTPLMCSRCPSRVGLNWGRGRRPIEQNFLPTSHKLLLLKGPSLPMSSVTILGGEDTKSTWVRKLFIQKGLTRHVDHPPVPDQGPLVTLRRRQGAFSAVRVKSTQRFFF